MAAPFFSAYDTISTPNGTWIKPGGQVVAYVRSTGAQSGDLPEVVVNMVATIALGVARCRAGFNDVVVVLPGHTETLTGTTSLFTAVSGAQIIGAGIPGASNAPNVTISAVGAGIALSAANMTIAGLNINSATAAVTGAVVVTGAGVTLANNVFSFTGALGANSPIAVTGAARFTLAGNNLAVDSTATMVAITGAASTNFLVCDNVARQTQGTSGGGFSTTANTAGISGMYCRNLYKTASTVVGGAGVIVIGAANIATVGNFENYGCDETAAAGLLVTGAA